jgi:hypothetical protein
LRAKVPLDLVHVLGKREIVKALETSVHADAINRLRVASCEVDATFAEARRRLKAPTLGDGSIRRIARDWRSELEPNPSSMAITALSDVELRQIVVAAFADWDRRSAESFLASPTTEADVASAMATLVEDEAALQGPVTRWRT